MSESWAIRVSPEGPAPMVSSSDLGDRPQWSPEFPILLTTPRFPRGTGTNGLLVTSPRAFIPESALLPPWAPLP